MVQSFVPPIPLPLENHLLAALTCESQQRLLPSLEIVDLLPGQTLHTPGASLRHGYFPIDCIVSLQNTLESGSSAEVAIVGREGFVGTSVFMGAPLQTTLATVLTQGLAYRIAARPLQAEFSRHGDFLFVVLRYTQALIAQMAQTAACNRHHRIDPQLARWLLMMLDRLPGNQLPITQELIARMLGVRREGITDAAYRLQRRGVIRYARGLITVLDRRKLESLSCECYGVVRDEVSRLTRCGSTPLNVRTG